MGRKKKAKKIKARKTRKKKVIQKNPVAQSAYKPNIYKSNEARVKIKKVLKQPVEKRTYNVKGNDGKTKVMSQLNPLNPVRWEYVPA